MATSTLNMAYPVMPPTMELRTWSIATSVYRPATGEGFDNDRWLAGVSFAPYGCGPIDAGMINDDICDVTPTETAANLTFPNNAAAPYGCVAFEPFRVRFQLDVQALSSIGTDAEEWFRTKVRMSRSYRLAHEVWLGLLSSVNPSLADEADDVTANVVDSSPVAALAAVEDALGQKLTNGLGMIHVTPGQLVLLQSGGGLGFDGTNYRTATGHYIVADAGYLGGEPASGAGATGAVTAGESWIYGSGLVYWKSTLGEEGEWWELFNVQKNRYTYEHDEQMIAVFDPCAVVAAKIA